MSDKQKGSMSLILKQTIQIIYITFLLDVSHLAVKNRKITVQI